MKAMRTLFLATAVLPVVAAILEVGIRLAAPQPIADIAYDDIFTDRYSASLSRKVKALVPGIVRSRGGKEVRINSRGNRDYEYRREKGMGVQRIAVVGSSETFGFMLAIEDTFAKLLERSLNEGREQGSHEVLAFGRPGLTTGEAYAYVMDEVFGYDPDVIIYSLVQISYESVSPDEVLGADVDRSGRNDTSRIASVPSPLSVIRRQFSRIKQIEPLRSIIRKSHLYLFAANSVARLVRAVSPAERRKGQFLEALQPDSPQFLRKRENTEQWIALVANECRRRRISFAVMALPYEMQLSRKGLEKWRARGISVPEEALLLETHGAMRQFCDNRGVPFIDVVPDLRRAADRGREIFLENDYGHLNREGNEIVADVLRRWHKDGGGVRRR